MVRALRRQLPAYSPLSPAALAKGVLAVLCAGPDPRARLATLLGVRYSADGVVLVGSGTQALQLALTLAQRQLSERAAVAALPAFTCFDVASAAVGADLRVTCYDLDPVALAPDLDSLRRALQRGSRIIVVSPLYGIPVDWHAVEQCAAPFGAVVIEDAAQGHGARWRDRPLGSLGPLSVLSFARGKGWSGAGGGALLLRDATACDLVRRVSLSTGVGKDAATVIRALVQWAWARPGVYRLPSAIPWLHLGETRYRPPRAVCGMSRASAALLLASRPLADFESGLRRAAGRRLAPMVARLGAAAAVEPPADGAPGYLRFPLRLRGGLAALPTPHRAATLGWMRSYPASLPDLPALAGRLVACSDSYPGAETLVRDLVTLPTHSRVGVADQRATLDLLAQLAARTAASAAVRPSSASARAHTARRGA